MESLLQERIQHPNIVRNYRWHVRKVPTARRRRSSSDYGADGFGKESDEDGGSGGGSQAPPLRMMQAWLVLEYCNRGSVHEAVAKGWFRQGRGAAAPPAVRAILTTAGEVASALAYLHKEVRGPVEVAGGGVLGPRCDAHNHDSANPTYSPHARSALPNQHIPLATQPPNTEHPARRPDQRQCLAGGQGADPERPPPVHRQGAPLTDE